MRTKSNLLATVLFVLVLVGISIGSRAQDYPTRPVTIIVPTAAGGGVDLRGD
jgi:tripartite-type tricarboxylate transporter receptor subunit TctC